MARVLVNVMGRDWAVHFIGPDGRTRIGPWLLLDSKEEVLTLLRWANATEADFEAFENAIQCWGVSTIATHLSAAKLASLIKRGQGWPWNGYELRLMKAAGKYPPKRLDVG
jgi:hypothetical protein